ncbi:MAG: sulfatase-like hydrolase/transferase, partial [Solirubrobacterales bacterium]|nr:sulfatase-like hydrolase/transferase [Solirubrobacterales bacterium]
MRCRAATGIALIALLFAFAACGGGSESSQAAKRHDDPRPERVSAADAADKPNVIFIYTDDQNLADFKARYMPQTFKLLTGPGTQFSDFIVATPLCCPSRATYITGDYPHNDGVFSNPSGYSHLTDKFNTLQVWMHNAGYRTAWVGKYLQGYEEGVPDPFKAAPGNDDWHATFDPVYYDYDIADNGAAVHHGSKPRDYYTNV